jgi:hypothetical protein
LTLSLFALSTGPARAKVVFTGYGDFRVTGNLTADIEGPAAILGAFNISDTTIKSRGSRLEAVGIFATTNLSPNLDFLMDVTYREIGPKVNDLRLQYAYLNYAVSERTALSAGKITFPFGYLNQKEFYPFQRIPITAPLFQQAILGLPMADVGASLSHRLDVGPARLTADVYAVNGYGPISGSSTSFRNGSLPGALVIANNLASRDANNRTALGGRLTFSPSDGRDAEAGVSYYGGQWDPQGTRMLQMGNAHVHMNVASVYFLAEYLLLNVKGDQGFANNVGVPDWRTTGYFAKTAYEGFKIKDMPLIPWLRYEDYATRGLSGGTGREKLRSPAGGLTLQAMQNLALKLEISRISYVLPFQSQGDLKLKADSYLFAIDFTF